MPDRIASGLTAQQHLLAGIDALADVLAVTLGPVGRSVVVENELTHKPEILESAAEIARRLTSLSAPHQNTGAMLLRHVVWRVVSQTGDGGATAAVFARALYRDALRLVTAGMNPLALGAGIETAAALVVGTLRQQACPLATEDELARMALSLVGEKPLAAILGEMSYLLGENAVIAVEKYAAPTIDRVYVSGAAYPAQIASPLFYTQPAQKRAAASETLVALLDDALQTGEDAAALLQTALAAGTKHLTILTSKTIGEKALGLLSVNHRNAAVPISILPARLTEVDQAGQYPLSDLALLTGATVLSAATGQPAARARPEQLGTARRVEVTDQQIILETTQNEAVRQAIEELRQRLNPEIADHAERLQLQQRLAALTGGLGYLRVGAYGDQERAARAKNAERALKALAAAQRGGVVAGGGAALVYCAAALKTIRMPDEDQQQGVKLFARALAAPLLQLLHNAGIEAPGAVLQGLAEAGDPLAYDVTARQFANAYTSGLVTPVPVLEAVIRVATSSIVMALTTGTILYHRADAVIDQVEP